MGPLVLAPPHVKCHADRPLRCFVLAQRMSTSAGRFAFGAKRYRSETLRFETNMSASRPTDRDIAWCVAERFRVSIETAEQWLSAFIVDSHFAEVGEKVLP